MDRIILHSDLNNFYASVECLLNPKITNTAVIVVGNEELRHGVVLAKNNLAKSLGIRTGDTVIEAQPACGYTRKYPRRCKQYIANIQIM